MRRNEDFSGRCIHPAATHKQLLLSSSVLVIIYKLVTSKGGKGGKELLLVYVGGISSSSCLFCHHPFAHYKITLEKNDTWLN